MDLKVLHYVFNGPPISSGYNIRTQSIVKAQKKKGISPSVAISVKSLIGNYFKRLNFAPKNMLDGVNYYSAHDQLIGDIGFKLVSGLLINENKITNRLRTELYKVRQNKILSRYYDFLNFNMGEIDIVHAHSPSVAFEEAYRIGNLFNKKIIYEVRGFWNLSVESANQDVMKAVKDEISACEKADRCIAICKGIADVLIQGGISPQKIDIVPNGVEPEKFASMEKDLSLLKNMKLEGKIIFGYITSVRWFEGIQTVVRAWSKILSEIPNAVFLLVGDGSYLESIKTMVGEYKIQDSFLVLGRIPNEKIAAYYSLLDVFVVPRINVPVSNIVTPLKPLEAMVNGKVVVVSDVSALKEMVIDGETGLFFKADDHDNLADVFIQLAKNRKIRYSLGQRAREWVLANRTWDKLAEQYLEIYNNTLNGKKI